MVCKSKPFHFSGFQNPFDVEAKASAWRPREPVSRDEGFAGLWFSAVSSLPGVYLIGLWWGEAVKGTEPWKTVNSTEPAHTPPKQGSFKPKF